MGTKMKITDIKGKPYIEVNERIKHFRSKYSGQIITTIISNDCGVCIFKAEIIVDGLIVATGHAYEKEGSSFINKTSYIENCETSAVGRALGILGIGIDTSVASADEVQNAIENQKPKTFKQLMYDLNSALDNRGLTDHEKDAITTFYCANRAVPIPDLSEPEEVQDFIFNIAAVVDAFNKNK